MGGGIYDFESQMFPTRSNNERWEKIYKITGAEPSPSPGKFVPKGRVIATYSYVSPTERCSSRNSGTSQSPLLSAPLTVRVDGGTRSKGSARYSIVSRRS